MPDWRYRHRSPLCCLELLRKLKEVFIKTKGKVSEEMWNKIQEDINRLEKMEREKREIEMKEKYGK